MEKIFFKDDSFRDKKVNEIIETEWKMFQDVNNIGGRALCQDDWDTFSFMRYSQTKIMDDATIESYLKDLEKALLLGRNLLTEKYAYMMEITHPDYYERELKGKLPQVDDTVETLAREIADCMTASEEEFGRTYPKFRKRGRPIDAETGGDTSLRTYALGELKTYSVSTLMHLRNAIQTLEKQGKSIAYIIHNEIAKFYGFENVKEAEDAL